MFGDAPGKLRRRTVMLVVTGHSHTVVANRKGNLTSGLYPDLLESKHQITVALNLFTDSTHHSVGTIT